MKKKSLLPEDAFDIEVLFELFEEYIEAKQTHDRERDAYDGYSWDYFGQPFINAKENAARKCKEKLREIVVDILNSRDSIES